MMPRLARVLLVAAIAVGVLPYPAAADCGDVACNCLQMTMTCKGQGGAALLPSIPVGVTTVSIAKYQIATLANNSFVGRQLVTSLTLETNGIATIETYAFAGLPALQYLSMAFNSIQQLPDRVFQNLSRLSELRVGDNALSALAGNAFIGLGNLLALDLSGNFLSTLPSAAFKYLVSLQQLDLSNNKIASLPSDAFSGLASLTTLSLSGNRLSSLTADGLFAGSVLLQTLDLSSNRLTQVSAGSFSNLTALAALNLAGALTPCDCSAVSLRSWLDSPSAAQVKADWFANPFRSCRCSSPQPVQGVAFVNVPADAFVCTTTAAPTTAATPATTRSATAAVPSSPAAPASAATAATTVRPSVTAALSGQDTTTPALMSGSTVSIVLGCSIGAAALIAIILVTWAVRRHLLRQHSRRPPKDTLESVGAKPIHVAKGGVEDRRAAAGGGSGGWTNGGYSSSPSSESVDGDGGAGQLARSLPGGGSGQLSAAGPADASPASGYYERVAADLQQASAGALRSPLKMNGLLPYAYTRQNSGRAPAAGNSRAKTKALSPGSPPPALDDQDKAASLRFYSSHGALSPASATDGRSPVAADRDRLYRSMRAPARTLPHRNAALTSSLRFAAAGLSDAGSSAGAATASAAAAAGGSPSRPAPPPRAISDQGLLERAVLSSATGPGNPFATIGAAPTQQDAMLQAPRSPRSAGWLASSAQQFSFPPLPQNALPPPPDYSTLGSSRSLSVASGSLASGGGSSGPHLADRVRFINDTPV